MEGSKTILLLYFFPREKSSTVVRVQPSTIQAKSEEKDEKDPNNEGTPC